MNDDNIRDFTEGLESLRRQLALLTNVYEKTLTEEQRRQLNLGDAAKQVREFGEDVGDTHPILRAQRDYLADQNKRLHELNNTIKSSTESVKRGFDSLLNQSDRTFSKYNSSIDSASNALGSLAKTIFGENIGKGFELLFNATSTVTKSLIGQYDRLNKVTDELNKVGATIGLTTTQFRDLAHNAGVTSRNLEVLARPLKDFSINLTSLATNTTEGNKEFVKLTSISREQRMSYQMLGVSQEELIKNQADYLTLQAISGRNIRAEVKDRQALQRETLEYTDNLMVLANLTGQDVESIKKKQQAEASELDWQLSQFQLQEKANELITQGKREEALAVFAEAKARQKALDQITGYGNDIITKGFRSILATGSIYTDQAQALSRSGLHEDVEKLGAALKRGVKAEDAAAEFQNAVNAKMTDTLKNVSVAAQYSKEVAGQYGIDSQFMINHNKQRHQNFVEEQNLAKERVAAQKESGFDTSKTARAALTELEIIAGKAVDKLALAATGATLALSAFAGVLMFKGIGGVSGIKEILTGLGKNLDKLSGLDRTTAANRAVANAAGVVSKATSLLTKWGPLLLAGGAVGAAVDAGLGAVGVGKGEVKKEQDEENWKKMSSGEKFQSGIARGIEHLADVIFLGNMANQARIDRIEKETEYFKNKKEVTTQPQPSTKQPLENNEKIPKLAKGGVVEGPTTGYPAILHGKEMVIPLNESATKLGDIDLTSLGLIDDKTEEHFDKFEKSLEDSDKAFKKLIFTLVRLERLNKKDLELKEDMIDAQTKVTENKPENKIEGFINSLKNKIFGGSSGSAAGTNSTSDGAVATGSKPTSSISDYLKKVAIVESGGKSDAKASTSSASGLFQFTEGTWKQTVKEMGKNYSLEDRFDPSKSTEVAAYFSNKQKTQLEKSTGQSANDVDLYMAHFLGAAGASKFLNAMRQNPDAPASAGADPDQIRANMSIFMTKDGQQRSLKEIYQLMANKLGKAESMIAKGNVSDDVKNIGGTQSATASNKPIPQAQSGGIFQGPDSGYIVELHGNETVIPTPKISSVVKKDLNDVVMPSTISGSDVNFNIADRLKDVVDMKVTLVDTMKSMQTDFRTITEQYTRRPLETTSPMIDNNMDVMGILTTKLDTLIDRVSESNSTQEKMLQYARI